EIAHDHLSEPELTICKRALKESLKPDNPRATQISATILASPIDLAESFATHLSHQGWKTTFTQIDNANVLNLSQTLVEQAHRLKPGQAWIAAAEPTIKLGSSTGTGGRAGWTALHALQSLPMDATIWAAASDGVDGSSGMAGACVSGTDKLRVDPHKLQDELARHNDTEIHRMLGTSLPGNPTGLNYTDLYAVLRPPSAAC
ncbi:MAG: hypothetical protein FWD57_14780, partial [Polyangiaceae bacterium]|nr:hypothetical protein [Polyangiaceae bacterium]